MKSKPSSANSKAYNLQQKVILTKKPTIVKCFICNQMFYSQQTFDMHMDQHQKKVNKNLPEEIQRKTLQSFGLKRKQSINKKNTTLQAINQNQLADKAFLNKTMKVPMVYGQKLQNYTLKSQKQSKILMKKRPQTKTSLVKNIQQKSPKNQQNLIKKQSAQDKQIQQIDQAIRQSSMLMSQITFLTQRVQKQQMNNYGDETHSEEQQQEADFIKQFNEGEFIKFVKNTNASINKIEQQFLRTFITHNKSLQNCQIQIQYLRKIGKLSVDSKSLQKISKIKGKVMQEVINLIMAKEASQQTIKNNKNTEVQQQSRDQENREPRVCSSCLDTIGFGQICSIVKSEYYHKDCLLQDKR